MRPAAGRPPHGENAAGGVVAGGEAGRERETRGGRTRPELPLQGPSPVLGGGGVGIESPAAALGRPGPGGAGLCSALLERRLPGTAAPPGSCRGLELRHRPRASWEGAAHNPRGSGGRRGVGGGVVRPPRKGPAPAGQRAPTAGASGRAPGHGPRACSPRDARRGRNPWRRRVGGLASRETKAREVRSSPRATLAQERMCLQAGSYCTARKAGPRRQNKNKCSE